VQVTIEMKGVKMSNAGLQHSHQLKSPAVSGTGLSVALGLAVWFALVFLLGAGEVFVTSGGTPPLALLIAVTAPVIIFLAGFWVSHPFREFVLAADLRLMMGMQAWRFAGFIFLTLYTYGVLPGYFAWPAGLGDMAIGVTAPWLLVALIRQPSFAASKIFAAWNVFGILDLVVAVGLGALGPRLLAVDAAGAVATAPMAHLPLVFIPAFLVPIFIILHIAALFQARRFAGKRRS
jgi:hypothetical protein